MPTSKDLLKDAQKTLKTNDIIRMALKDVAKTGTSDVAEFAKARSVLATSMNSMSGSIKMLEGKLKKLNAGLSALKKTEPVMKAPADKKIYDKLTKDYTEMIKDGMTFHKEIQGLLKTGQKLRKS